MSELIDHPEDTREVSDQQAGTALAELVVNGSLYLWTDEGCQVGFHLDEPAGGAGQFISLGELLDQAVYRNLPPAPRRRGAYRFGERGLAEMRALREVLAEAMALIDRHMPSATVSRPPAGRQGAQERRSAGGGLFPPFFPVPRGLDVARKGPGGRKGGQAAACPGFP